MVEREALWGTSPESDARSERRWPAEMLQMRARDRNEMIKRLGLSSEEIASFKHKLKESSHIADSVIVVGDVNIHHRPWLRCSSEDIPRGKYLKDVCILIVKVT